MRERARDRAREILSLEPPSSSLVLMEGTLEAVEKKRSHSVVLRLWGDVVSQHVPGGGCEAVALLVGGVAEVWLDASQTLHLRAPVLGLQKLKSKSAFKGSLKGRMRVKASGGVGERSTLVYRGADTQAWLERLQATLLAVQAVEHAMEADAPVPMVRALVEKLPVRCLARLEVERELEGLTPEQLRVREAQAKMKEAHRKHTFAVALEKEKIVERPTSPLPLEAERAEEEEAQRDADELTEEAVRQWEMRMNIVEAEAASMVEASAAQDLEDEFVPRADTLALMDEEIDDGEMLWLDEEDAPLQDCDDDLEEQRQAQAPRKQVPPPPRKPAPRPTPPPRRNSRPLPQRPARGSSPSGVPRSPRGPAPSPPKSPRMRPLPPKPQ